MHSELKSKKKLNNEHLPFGTLDDPCRRYHSSTCCLKIEDKDKKETIIQVDEKL